MALIRHITDTDAINRIAITLAYCEDWSPGSDFLDAINQIVSTVRHNPGSVDPDYDLSAIAYREHLREHGATDEDFDHYSEDGFSPVGKEL